MTAPRTYTEYETDRREPDLVAEMAKIRLMEQMVAAMDDQNDLLEAIARNTNDGREHYTQ